MKTTTTLSTNRLDIAVTSHGRFTPKRLMNATEKSSIFAIDFGRLVVVGTGF